MFCGKCGKEVAGGKKFCPYCGNRLASSSPGINTPPAKAMPGKKEKRKIELHINKALLITIMEILLLGGLVWGFLRIGQTIYGPEAMVNEYMKALAEDDWDTIMYLTDIEESGFLTKDSLKKAISGLVPEDFDSYDVSLRKQRGSTAEVQVKYGSDGRNRNSLDLIVDKQDDKELMLFDTWKVSAENYVIEDFVIYSPKGTDVYFDGIQLDEGMIKEGYVPDVENGESFTRYAESYNSFVIPKIYIGKHECAALVGDNAVSALKFEATEENTSVAMTEIASTEKLQSEIISTAHSDLEKILNAKVNGQSFDDIADIYISLPDTINNARQNYENSLNDYYAADKERGIKQIAVRNGNGVLQDFYLSNEGELTAQANLEFEYDSTVVNKNWWSGEQEESVRENNNGVFRVYMVFNDDTWKIRDAQLPYGL